MEIFLNGVYDNDILWQLGRDENSIHAKPHALQERKAEIYIQKIGTDVVNIPIVRN